MNILERFIITEEGIKFNSKRWWQIFKKPSTIAVSSLAISCSVLGYIGTRWLVTEKLPSSLEKQLSSLELGEVTSFSFNSITFGESAVSVDDDDPDYVTVDKVEIDFNLLSAITRRILPLEITLVDPNIYLEQDNNGTWLKLPESFDAREGLPIDFDITVIAKSAEVALQPNERQDLIELELNGGVNYNQAQLEYIKYDLDLATGEAVATAKGETRLTTKETKAQILVEDLSLSKIAALLPHKPPIDVRQGNLNADLDVVIPSLEETDDARINGQVSLQKLEATAELDKPITARSHSRFQDEKANINNSQASIGDIVANIDGRINQKTGYDVNIVLPVAIGKLQEIVPAVAVDVKGKLKANLELTGAITKPVLTGTISNTQPVTVAETTLDKVEAKLTTNLEQAVLNDLSIIPAAGGEITGRGIVGNNSQKPVPLSFKFKAQLPAESLLQPYYATNVLFNVGTVTATATVDGSLDNPEVLVDWQAPAATTSAKTNISGNGKIIYNDSTLAINNTVIDIDSGELNVSGTVDLVDNSWQGALDASNVPLNSWLQPLKSKWLKLGESVALSNGTVRLNGLLTQNLLDTVDGVAKLDFAVGSGNISLSSNINSGNLKVAANAIAVPVDNLVTGIELSKPVDAQVDLSANLDSLAKITVDTNNLAVRVGEQIFNANGKMVLADLTTNPEIANVDLNLQTNSNLATLPNQLLNNVSTNNKFLAGNFNLAGGASFEGRLQGKNLLANPSNIDLTGDVQLENLNLGNMAFEALAGTVDISPREAITIDLQGRDAIAVNLEPCTRKPCPLPYLPTNIEIRQGEDTPEPVVATAKRQGEFLDIDVANFPLSMLNLQLGVPGKLAGELTGEALVNLFTLAATGEVRVIAPSVGYIDGKTLIADFAYNPQQNLAKLAAATLKFGESIYILEGTYNSKTQEIAGELDITQGYVQDLISAFGWYDIQRATELFQPPNVFDSASLPTLEVGKKGARVDDLLKLSVIVRERLEEIADRDPLGTPLDIEGAYQGKVAIAGNLASPNVAWEITGDNWVWDTDSDVALEIPRPQGLIAIADLRLAGEYNNEAITLDSLSLQGTRSSIALSGQLQQEQLTAQYNLVDLPLDVIQNFVDIPLEVAGKISTEGRVSQTLQNLKLVGDVTLERGRLSDRSLPKIIGEYVYNNKRLELDTSETPSAKILASIPFPVEPGNDKISLSADIDEGGVALIDGFTGGALEFIGGEADITLNANARLDLDADFIFQDLDLTGNASLNNSILKTAAVTEPLNITAEIALDEKLIQVEQLSATFAQSKIAASGVLPLFESVENISQPLTLDIYESQIDLDQLYQGGIEGEVIITGNAFSPLVGGRIELFDGRAFFRGNEVVENKKKSAFKLLLKDLNVVLSDFKVQQAPLYNIALEGDLILNGPANNRSEITADGILNLTRADVDFVSNKFNLQQDYKNIVVFNRDTSILNPSIDVRLTSKVAKPDNTNFSVVENNEIPDPISFTNQNITVYLIFKGEAKRIVSRIGKDPNRFCLTEPAHEPLFAENIYTQEKLTQLAECVNSQAFEKGSAQELLNSSAVSLESNPPRDRDRILSLLGNSFLGLAEGLQDKNEEQLLGFGVTKLVLPPLEREVFSFAEGAIDNIGEEIGLDYLRIYPNLEATYRLTKDSSISASYDYFFNEAQIRYQKQF